MSSVAILYSDSILAEIKIFLSSFNEKKERKKILIAGAQAIAMK